MGNELSKIYEEARDQVDEPVRAKLLKHFEKSGNEPDYERANSEFGRYGFNYNTQGAIYASPMGVSVWVPRPNILVCHADIFDNTHWFAIEMDPREVQDIIHKLKSMGRAIEDVEGQEHTIVGDWMQLAGIDEPRTHEKMPESKKKQPNYPKCPACGKTSCDDPKACKQPAKPIKEAADQQAKFWLVLDPSGPESVIEDVLGTPRTVVEIGRILIGGGKDSHEAINRWEKEHPALYIEEDESSARADAEARLAAVKGPKNEDVPGSGGVGSQGAP